MESCALFLHHLLLTELKGRGETRRREGGTWVDGPMLDPPQRLSPEPLGQEEFILQLLPGEITSACPPQEIPYLLREPGLGLILFFSNS